jgi:ornithine cyclodeaminase/alanine dehydrogenase-like protein (mu-crystallin family)
MINISEEQLEENLDYPILIEALRKAFQEKYIVPFRHHHNYQNPKEGVDSTLLLMPAWQVGKYLGVKMVTVSPKNGKYNLPSIHGVYTLFNAEKGMPLAQINATKLTAQRTAAASALASSFLSKKNSKTLFLVGTGALAPELIRAHISVRPIETVYVWGRNLKKAKVVSDQITKHTKNNNLKISLNFNFIFQNKR